MNATAHLPASVTRIWFQDLLSPEPSAATRDRLDAVPRLEALPPKEVAVKLGEELRGGARFRAVLERQMGRRLDRLRDMKGFSTLGPVKLRDDAALRLDLERRSAQEMARPAMVPVPVALGFASPRCCPG